MITSRSERLAYLAGFVDGEGCLRLAKSERPRQTPRYDPIIRVGQKDPMPLETIQSWFGGRLWSTRSSNRSTQWRWGMEGKAALKLIAELEPYLILKRRQAQELLKLKFTPGVRLTIKEIEKRDRIRSNLTHMKRTLV